MEDQPAIAIIGASGLIGQAVAADLARRGLPVAAVARQFTSAQKTEFAGKTVESPVVTLSASELGRLFAEANADVVVNCVGVLQGSPRGRTEDVHGAFAARLIAAIASSKRPILLVQISIPGRQEDDKTDFSRSKRQAERLIVESKAPFVILRPGFVIADAAYGGSALIRALAALPVWLPAAEGERPFATTSVSDIAATIAIVALRWRNGERDIHASWDVMERHPSSVNGVIESFRQHFGGPKPWLTLPSWLINLGALGADFAGRLGWSPPVRSTALAEMRRGVAGDPAGWIAATGIEPKPLSSALAVISATIQERWFARLYLAKALIIGSLAAFWLASGAIALTAGFDTALAILVGRGIDEGIARGFVGVTSVLDVMIGVLIAFRSKCQFGLLTGLAVSASYAIGATLLAPELWGDPLGPLVKVLPSVVLTLVALAVLDDR